MCIEDYEELSKLWKSSQGIGMSEIDDSKIAMNQFLIRNPDTCFVYLEDHHIRAAVLCGFDGRRAYIYHACVDKDYRRRGIAKALIKKLELSLKEKGVHKLALLVYVDNDMANEFWESQGYHKREDLYYRNKVMV